MIDLVKLASVARIAIGQGLSGMREHPTRAEIWGVSSAGGYVWVINARVNQVSSRIPVGPLPYAIDFSPDGSRLYTTSAGSDTLLAIDCQTRSVVARTRTGGEPVVAHVTPDGKSVLVLNHRDATLGIHDAGTLALRSTVGIVKQPEKVAILPDNSLAFVLSRTEHRLSVVDLRRSVLVTNLELDGNPSDSVAQAGRWRAVRDFTGCSRVASDQHVDARGGRLPGARLGAPHAASSAPMEIRSMFRTARRGTSFRWTLRTAA